MDEAQEATVDNAEVVSTENTNDNTEVQAQETAQEAHARTNPEREWVDPAKDSPEKVKERLDFLYGKVKKTEREQSEWKRLAADQAAIIEELRNSQTQVVTHLTQQNFANSEAQLESQMMDALQAGDTKAYLSAQNKLIDLKTDQRLIQQKQPKLENKPQMQTTTQRLQSASEMATELPFEEQTTIEAWQQERDERGQALRPWAANTGTEEDPDPDYVKAVLEARKVFTNPAFTNLTMNQKLAEVDKRMGVKKTGGGQTVMGGGLTSKPKTGRINLSPQIEKMAIRTKFGGPKAKSDAEHIEAYRKQIEKVKSTRGAQ